MFKGVCAALKKQESNLVHSDQKREFCGISVHSLGLGTYLGNSDFLTDQKVIQAGALALERGINIIDTAVNYRCQRAEKSVAEVLKRVFLAQKLKREDVFISTKGGFVPFEDQPSSLIELFQKSYVQTGIAELSDLVAKCHCMSPNFLKNQIELSRKNLNLETIDLYYLHNPETQLEEVSPRVFYERLESAFVALEESVRDKKIVKYGMATWNGLRVLPEEMLYLDLKKCVELAQRAHKRVFPNSSDGISNFAAIQVPLNLAMPEAAFLENQFVDQFKYSAIEAAKKLKLSVAVSAPLFQSRLCHDLPKFILERFPEEYSQSFCALSFATSFQSVDVALVGMKERDHVEHNLSYLQEASLAPEDMRGIFAALVSGNQ
jgi:aryl-alcohol dehydrogenase-like predicted oxidoreductase